MVVMGQDFQLPWLGKTMTPREYAVSLGLAKPGARGKLSRQAQAAIQIATLEGYKFDEEKNGTSRSINIRSANSVAIGDGDSDFNRVVDSQVECTQQSIKSLPVTHDYNTVWGIDTRIGRPIAIAYQYCSACLLQVTYCLHPIPKLPAYLGFENGLTVKPTQAELDATIKDARA